MDVVAVISLGTAVEVEAPILAAELGVTAYDAGLMLRVPSPMLVLRTDDRARAIDLLARLRTRGHDAVACDVAAVAAPEAMTIVRTFRLEPDALVADVPTQGQGIGERRLPWADVVAIVRAVHRSRSEQTKKTEVNKLSLGRAAMTGGLLATRTVTKETKVASEEREHVLYVFPASGAPWLLALSKLRYEALGRDLQPAQLANFTTLTRVLRERAKAAVYDERLVAPRPTQEKIRSAVQGQQTSSSAPAVDLLAHLVAMAVVRQRPYR